MHPDTLTVQCGRAVRVSDKHQKYVSHCWKICILRLDASNSGSMWLLAA